MTRRVNVMLVIDSLRIGGAERQFLELLKGTDRERFTPTAVCLSENLEMLKEARGLSALVYRRRSRFDLSLAFRLAKVMRAKRIDIVQSYLWLAGVYARIAAKLAGVPVVISGVRGKDYSMSSLRGRLVWAVDRVLARSTTAIVTNSGAMLQYLKESGFDPAKIRVIHNGVNGCFERTIDVAEAKVNLGLDRLDPTVGICGRLSVEKDHRTFLLAAKEVLDVLPQAKFLVIGDGPLRDSLEQLADDLNISQSVMFTGMVNGGVEKVMAALDVSVLCSLHEAFPNAILESMALGKPVVATAVGGCAELVVDGETGILVPSGACARLADGILRLLKEQDVARRMGETGYQRYKEYFAVDRMVRDYESLYVELLEAKKVL